jgi:hypothetical protein
MSVSRTSVWGAAFVLSAVGALAGCQGSQDDNTGVARLAIMNVPKDVTCVRVLAMGTRLAFADSDVKAGQPVSFIMEGLPVGSVKFQGFGLLGVCAVTSDDDPTWVSDVVTKTLVGGTFTDVALTMHPNGEAFVSVDFQPDQPPGADAGSDAGARDAGADAARDR